MAIDMRKFCEEEIPNIATPFWRDGYLYASNGRYCVRVPSESGEPGHALAPAANRLEHWWTDDSLFAWEPFPESGSQKLRCDECRGTGQDFSIGRCCPKCGNNDFPCEDCEGTGWVDSFKNIMVGGFLFSGRFIHMLSSLPNSTVNASKSPTDKPYQRTGILRIRFDGGQALLMGITQEHESSR